MLESDEGPGGAEVVVLELADALRGQGYCVRPVVLTRERTASWLERHLAAAGFLPERVRIRGALDWRCLRDLVGLLRDQQAPLVHSHEFSMAVYGAAAARWLGLPHVITLHGNMWMTDAWRRRAALRWAIRRSHGTVAVSHDTRRQLLADLGLPDGAIQTLWNGMPEPRGDRAVVRAELGLGPDAVLITAVGNLIERKGHADLLTSLGVVLREAPELAWHVAIAGEGPERERLGAIGREHGMADRLHLLGFRTDVGNLLAATDVFAMPSWWEGLPLALLEAMFAGNAVVASNVSGIPEAIPSADIGILVPPRDRGALASALHRVLGDAALRARLGRAARERALSTFTVERMTDDYVRLYRLAAERNSGRRLASSRTVPSRTSDAASQL
jgi:glycosyltransferase involved in cell wall biosynthesis